MEIQAHIARQSAQNCLITVTAPETLNGVTVECSGDTISLCYGAIKQPLDITKIPQAAFAPAIIRALDGISDFKEQNAAITDPVLNISTDFGEIVAALDEQTGAIKTIEIPSQQVTVTFSSFKALT